MKGLLLALCLALGATTTRADEPPPVPEGGLSTIYEAPCSDNETGIEGYCYFMQDVSGDVYLTFWVNDELMFIRHVIGDGYEVIWIHPAYNAI